MGGSRKIIAIYKSEILTDTYSIVKVIIMTVVPAAASAVAVAVLVLAISLL